MPLRGIRTICIDAWNQAGVFETSFSLRAAMSGAERDDATIKIAKLSKKLNWGGGKKCSMTVGFKAGQSAHGGLGLEREVSQTLNSHMSALEPTLFRCQSFCQNTREEVRKVNGDGRVASALSAETGTHQTNYIKSEKQEEGETMLKAEVRRLTPTEGGRLQGFPEGYLDCLSADSSKYKVAGNSWAVNCARVVIKGIHRADKLVKSNAR